MNANCIGRKNADRSEFDRDFIHIQLQSITIMRLYYMQLDHFVNESQWDVGAAH
jgi:hypothetical protein